MPGKFKRSVRLRELFRSEITKALQVVKDPGMTGFITVTDVELSGDTKTARVHYSVLGNAKDRVRTESALERSADFIRRQLYNRLRLKFIPKISFHYDNTPEEAQKIEGLLDRIKAEEGGAPTEPAFGDNERLNDIASRGAAHGRRARRPRRKR